VTSGVTGPIEAASIRLGVSKSATLLAEQSGASADRSPQEGSGTSNPWESVGTPGRIRLRPPANLRGSLLTVGEAAEVLQVAKSTVYALCRRGQLPFVRVLHAIRIRPESIVKFVSEAKLSVQR
jgi:excisionase family DNA binding protein